MQRTNTGYAFRQRYVRKMNIDFIAYCLPIAIQGNAHALTHTCTWHRWQQIEVVQHWYARSHNKFNAISSFDKYCMKQHISIEWIDINVSVGFHNTRILSQREKARISVNNLYGMHGNYNHHSGKFISDQMKEVHWIESVFGTNKISNDLESSREKCFQWPDSLQAVTL